MKRSEAPNITAHYVTYAEKVDDIELNEAFVKYGKDFILAQRDKLFALGDKVYAPGKWTGKDILQHLIDAERVFSYRAMRFARNDRTALPSFDENNYAFTAEANRRDLSDLLDEFCVVRDSTSHLFESLTPEMLVRTGEVWSGTMSAAGIGFAIIGHNIHHFGILRERYYPLIT